VDGWEYEYGYTDTAKGKETQRIRDWSDWYWNDKYTCMARYRANSTVANGWEHEYGFMAESVVESSKASKEKAKK